ERHCPPRAFDPDVRVQRARPTGASRARIGEQYHSSEPLMAFLSRPIRSVASATLAAALVIAAATTLSAQRLLIPMDDAQQNHLKAYGLTYNAIKAGVKAEWLLNYRGGAFLLGDTPELRRQAGLAGITVEPIDDGTLGQIRAQIAQNNMEAVPLE